MITVMAEFWAVISNPFMVVAMIVSVLKTWQKVDTWLYKYKVSNFNNLWNSDRWIGQGFFEDNMKNGEGEK